VKKINISPQLTKLSAVVETSLKFFSFFIFHFSSFLFLSQTHRFRINSFFCINTNASSSFGCNWEHFFLLVSFDAFF